MMSQLIAYVNSPFSGEFTSAMVLALRHTRRVVVHGRVAPV